LYACNYGLFGGYSTNFKWDSAFQTSENLVAIRKYPDNTMFDFTQILLITADELKALAEQWSKKHPGEIFNLGYFRQNGRFDRKLINI